MAEISTFTFSFGKLASCPSITLSEGPPPLPLAGRTCRMFGADDANPLLGAVEGLLADAGADGFAEHLLAAVWPVGEGVLQELDSFG